LMAPFQSRCSSIPPFYRSSPQLETDSQECSAQPGEHQRLQVSCCRRVRYTTWPWLFNSMDFGLYGAFTRMAHAARSYSCKRPPSRSRRLTVSGCDCVHAVAEIRPFGGAKSRLPVGCVQRVQGPRDRRAPPRIDRAAPPGPTARAPAGGSSRLCGREPMAAARQVVVIHGYADDAAGLAATLGREPGSRGPTEQSGREPHGGSAVAPDVARTSTGH